MVLAKWLETVCLGMVMKNPHDEHAKIFDCIVCKFCFMCVLLVCVMVGVSYLRMRAAIFINLVAMRRALSAANNEFLSLAPSNLEAFQKANYLFHSAHN